MLALTSFALSALNGGLLLWAPAEISAPFNAAAAIFCFGVGLIILSLSHRD